MTQRTIFLIVLLLSLAPVNQDSLAQDATEASPLDIKLALPKAEFIPKEEMVATVTYKNISKQPVRILKLVGWGYPLSFDIVDSQGKHSAVIKIVRHQFAVDYYNDFIVLQPNETFNQQYFFHEMFSFMETEHYKITANYSPVWGLPSMQSNTVAVDVLGEEDIGDVVQFVLNVEDLQSSFHPEWPGRKPLILLKNRYFDQDPQLMKFGEPVLCLSKDAIDAKGLQNYIEFKKIQLIQGTVELYFQYSLENVNGKITLVKRNNEWTMKDKQILKGK